MMTSAVKETFKRIQSQPNVTGVMLITNDGIPLQTTVDSDSTVQVLMNCSSQTILIKLGVLLLLFYF